MAENGFVINEQQNHVLLIHHQQNSSITAILKPTTAPHRTLNLTEHLQTLASLLLTFPHQLRNIPKLGNPCVTHALINPTFARRYCCPLGPQPCESDGYFFFVAGGDAIREDVDFVALGEEIECRLGYADVGFYTDDYAAQRLVGREGGDAGAGVCDCLTLGRVGQR